MGIMRKVTSDQPVLPIHTYLQAQEITDGGTPDYGKPGMFKKFTVDVREFAVGLGITRQTLEDADGWDPIRETALMALVSMKKKKGDIIVEALLDEELLSDFHAPEYGYFETDADHDHWEELVGTLTIADIDEGIQHLAEHGNSADVIVCNSRGSLTLLNLLAATTVDVYPATQYLIGGIPVLTRTAIRSLKVIESPMVPTGTFILLDSRVRPVAARIKRDITLDRSTGDYGLEKSFYSIRMGALLTYPEAVYVLVEGEGGE